MSHRKPLIDQANDISAMVMEQCHMEHVSERVLRLQAVQLLMSEFAEMTAHIERSLRDHGEATPRLCRYLRETLRDLNRNTFGFLDVPTSEAATSLAAD